MQTGRCDAVVYDAPILATLRAQTPARYGPLAGVVETHDHYGVVLPKGSPLEASVDAAVQALLANGRISMLSRRWLAADIAKVPALA